MLKKLKTKNDETNSSLPSPAKHSRSVFKLWKSSVFMVFEGNIFSGLMTTFTAIVQKEEDMYVAKCPEIGTVSQGNTIEKAVSNLKEATELYLEEFPSKKPSKPLITTFEVTVLAGIKKNLGKGLC
jgi:predicted RNase H-like HicB family nuclease